MASTAELLSDAAAEALTTLGLTSGGTPLPIVQRKKPGAPEGNSQSLPQLVVSVGEEGHTQYQTALKKLKTYPVQVTIVTNTGQQAADDFVARSWRQQIETLLEAAGTWNGLAGWNRVKLTNKAPFDTSALAKDYNLVTVVADVQMRELRG